MMYENVEAWAEEKLKDLLDDLEETLMYEGDFHLAHLEQDARDNLLNCAHKYMAVIEACNLLRRKR
jgi:hypothetical protein